jgi:hypothetical protein
MTTKLSIPQVASICHETNKAYCESIGDHSQYHWQDAPQWQRQSTTNSVTQVLYDLDSPETLHNEWMEEKLATGWKYGSIKDSAAKEHPCLVPYEDLPLEQKAKDYLFKAIIDTLKSINMIDYEE